MKHNNSVVYYSSSGSIMVVGYCRSSDLDKIEIPKSVEGYSTGKKCINYVRNAKSVILIGCVYTGRETIKRGILGDDYPSYKEARVEANLYAQKLKSEGFKAKVTVGISIKNAVVLSGLGVWGKNSLTIHPEYGTKIRYCAIVTDWVPAEYGEPIKSWSPCSSCSCCLDSCPTGCLSDYKIDGSNCKCTYITDGMKLLETLPMCSICQDVCPYNNKKGV